MKSPLGSVTRCDECPCPPVVCDVPWPKKVTVTFQFTKQQISCDDATPIGDPVVSDPISVTTTDFVIDDPASPGAISWLLSKTDDDAMFDSYTAPDGTLAHQWMNCFFDDGVISAGVDLGTILRSGQAYGGSINPVLFDGIHSTSITGVFTAFCSGGSFIRWWTPCDGVPGYDLIPIVSANPLLATGSVKVNFLQGGVGCTQGPVNCYNFANPNFATCWSINLQMTIAGDAA